MGLLSSELSPSVKTARNNPSALRILASPAGRHGFTLVELSSVVVIIAVLVGLLTTALNHTKSKALRLTCLDNVRQLQFAWILYAQDNDGLLPLNQTAPAPQHHRIPFIRSSTNSWVVGNPLEDRTSENLRRGSLYPLIQSAAVYRCPLDRSTVTGHPEILRTRSYSMNAYLGGDPDQEPPPRMRESELMNPRAENTFVFIEQHEGDLWGSNFLLPPVPRGKVVVANSSWESTPADRHDQGANLSFADGHVEYWRWYSPKTPGKKPELSAASGRDLRDINRLRACVPQP